MFSHGDDVSLLNPGDTVVGWDHVFEAQERAMARFSEGEATAFETLVRYVTPELAFLVEIERRTMRLSSEQMAPRSLRATTIFRPEDGSWKIVHRHADLFADSRASGSIEQ